MILKSKIVTVNLKGKLKIVPNLSITVNPWNDIYIKC